MLSTADRDWRFGDLPRAHAAYCNVLVHDESDWHAAFQLAWIDAAFGPIDAQRITTLQRRGLSAQQLESMEVLGQRAQLLLEGSPHSLDGTLPDWSFDRMRERFGDDVAAWEEAAGRAARAMQYGLADSCFNEAARLAPERFFDPPRAMQSASSMAARHVAGLSPD